MRLKTIFRKFNCILFFHKIIPKKNGVGLNKTFWFSFRQRNIEKSETKCSIVDPKVLSPHSLEKATNGIVERLSTSTFVAFQVFTGGKL